MMFDCGVPWEHCSGALIQAQHAVRGKPKGHPGYDEARRCARRYAAAMTAATPGGPRHLPSKPERMEARQERRRQGSALDGRRHPRLTA